MSRADPLLMLADIARLASEHPDLDAALVRAIYHNQVMTTGRQPTLPQAREYIDRLTSDLDEVTLRATLGLLSPTGMVAATSPNDVAMPGQRRAGRPAWTCALFWARYREARARADPPHTNASIAAQFEMLNGDMGIEADYLRKLVRRFGLPPA
jgi:hypothetical protein